MNYLKEYFEFPELLCFSIQNELNVFQMNCKFIKLRFSYGKLNTIIQLTWQNIDAYLKHYGIDFIGDEIEKFINHKLDEIIFNTIDLHHFGMINHMFFEEERILKLNHLGKY